MASSRSTMPIGWPKYFPDDPYSDEDERVPIFRAFFDYFLRERREDFESPSLQRNGVMSINVEDMQGGPLTDFVLTLDKNAHQLIQCMGLAAHQALFTLKRVSEQKINCRLYGLMPHTPMKDLKANCIAKYVSLKGTVVRVGNVKPLVTEAPFVCTKCGDPTYRQFVDGKYAQPAKCTSPGCRGKAFALDRSNATTVDYQKIRLQEIVDDDTREAGRIPRTVEVELTEDLVDTCVPGDEVTVCGVVKVVSTEADSGRKSAKNKCMYFLYVEANSLCNTKQSSDTASSKDDLQFTPRDLEYVRAVIEQPNVFHLLVNSLCPAIFGHEVVKAGLLLALFGGCQRYLGDKNKIPVRGDPHILVVGDPGLGKSQLLTAVSRVAPRGVYVCGNTTTTSGLTVTLVRDSSGDYALEAGALVLGDQGCCCIDEFDKMGCEHQALLEAMEQQSISIAKAGIVCNLPARTSVIAAANPVGGHYNRAKTVGENIKLSSALLSRFDLIFILLDSPDEIRDQLLSEHVMKLHAGVAAKSLGSTSKGGGGKQQSNAGGGGLGTSVAAWDTQDRARPLSERLKAHAITESFEPLPPQLLRKYIAYSRKYVNPKLTEAAAQVLQAFYLNLRKSHVGKDCTPITTRQLESLIRLAQARARMECRESVTEQDALDVVDIMKESLYDVLTDEHGQLDFRRMSGMSKSREATRFVQELNRVSAAQARAVFNRSELYKVAQDIRLQVGSFDDFLDSLNQQNFLLMSGGGMYKLQTSNMASTPVRGRRGGRGGASDE